MPLIQCPECHNRISDRADSCPHCGLPARFFAESGNSAVETERASLSTGSIDLAALRNTLIAFDHSYRTLFGQGHYITGREMDNLKKSFDFWAELLGDKTKYEYCRDNAPR